jgi:CheY-like chemotaxis protein
MGMGEAVAARTMLLVEDEPATSWAMGLLLRRRGWAVATARTVEEALGALGRGPAPCWMMLDLSLPDGDGEEVLRRVREAGLPTRVVVTTGLADPERLDALSAFGPDAVLLKPVEVDQVFRVCEAPAVGPIAARESA